MRVIRSAGQNVSPSDDGRLFDQIFTDGLFEETTITHLGANNVALGAMYGIICGRDFTAEAQTVAVELPEDDAGTTGYIYVEIDTSSDDVITIGSALAPFTPTYEDLNTNGAVAQMIIAEYVASSVAITSLTPSYVMATSGSVLPGSVATVEVSPAVANHSVGDFILYGGQLYSVTAAISVGETLTPGTNISATSAGSELTSLKSGLTWKLAGTTTGTTPLSLPADYNELQVNVTLTSNYQVTQHFVRDELNGGWYLWGAAYASSSAPSTPLPVFAAAYISSTTFTLQSAQYSSTVVTNSAVTKVYYR